MDHIWYEASSENKKTCICQGECDSVPVFEAFADEICDGLNKCGLGYCGRNCINIWKIFIIQWIMMLEMTNVHFRRLPVFVHSPAAGPPSGGCWQDLVLPRDVKEDLSFCSSLASGVCCHTWHFSACRWVAQPCPHHYTAFSLCVCVHIFPPYNDTSLFWIKGPLFFGVMSS